jgi:hypothetical protein
LLNVGVDPRVRPYLDLLFPLPNGQDFGDGSAELRHAEVSPTRENMIVGKIDLQLSQNDSALFRFSHDPASQTSALQNPTFQDVLASKTQYFTAQETHLFSNNLLNVFRAAVNRTFRSDDNTPTVDIPKNLYFTSDPKFGSITINSLNALTTGASATSPVSYDQHIFDFSDTVTWNTSRHTVKFGGNAQRYQFDGFSYSRFGGNFVFRTLQEFLTLTRGGGAVANTFTGNLPGTDTQRNIRQSYYAFFVNDDYRPSSRLTINYGLRYEFITTPYDTQGRIAGLVSYNDLESGPLGVTPGAPLFKNPSLKDFAPRLGFSWAPSDNNRTALKGGAGIFYQPLTTSFYRGTAFRIYPYFAGISISQPRVFGPAIQQVLDAGTGLAVQKRSEFIDYNAKQPYIGQYYLNYQHELPGGLLADLGYIGSRGYNLPFYGDPNSVPAQQTSDGQWQIIPGATLRYPDWGRVRTRINAAHSWYNGLILKINRQFRNNLMFQGSYTLSKSTDEFSGGLSGNSDFVGNNGSAQDWWCVPCEKGRSSFDIRHVFIFNGTYLLPFAQDAHGMKGALGSGWQVSAILNATSGVPFQPFLGFDWAGDKEADGNAQRPSLAPGASDNPVTGTVAQWFDPLSFVLPAKGFYGNLGRNTIDGPGLLSLDGSVFKNIRIAATKSVQLRVEVFNLLNRANFNPPDVSGGLFNPDGSRRASPAQLTSTSTTARQVQFGIKALF